MLSDVTIMTSLSITTCFMLVISGLYVFIRGDWRHLRLKHAAVVLSTVAGLYMLFIYITNPGVINCQLPERLCFNYGLYGSIRNISFILFHIAIGRDAIKIKKYDRRHATPYPNLRAYK